MIEKGTATRCSLKTESWATRDIGGVKGSSPTPPPRYERASPPSDRDVSDNGETQCEGSVGKRIDE